MTTAAILSPCIGICRLDDTGYCEGCFRTGNEIARWIAMSNEERHYIMDELLPKRALVRG